MQLQNGWKYYDDLLLVISFDFLSNMKTELWNQTTMDGKILPEWKYSFLKKIQLHFHYRKVGRWKR